MLEMSKEITQITQAGGNTINPRSRLRKACFTLNNYSEEEYNKITQSFSTFKYVIGKEGDEKTPHLQGYVEFNKQLSFKQIKEMIPRAHIEKPRGNRDQNIAYCSKEGNFVSNFPMKRRERLLSKYSNVVWKEWQQDVINIINEAPDERTIHWIWDKDGNIGKSFLSKFIYLKYDTILGSGKKADVFNQINTWIGGDEEKDPHVILLDIPRYNLDYVNYGCIEEIKNGLIYSGKYEGGVCAFDPPHVIVFANEAPDLHKMSADRWRVVGLV